MKCSICKRVIGKYGRAISINGNVKKVCNRDCYVDVLLNHGFNDDGIMKCVNQCRVVPFDNIKIGC